MMRKIIRIAKIKSRPDYAVYTEPAEVSAENADMPVAYEIYQHFIAQYDLHEDAIFPEETLERLQQESRFRRVYERACYLLDARDYSYAMLYKKLMLSYQDASLCTRVMQKLVDAGAVNDRRYAQRYAEYLVQRKGYGIHRARQEMYRKGLDRSLINACLETQKAAAQENISAVLVKKYGRLLPDVQNKKTKEKIIAGMARLGYEIYAIQEAIAVYVAEQEEQEDF